MLLAAAHRGIEGNEYKEKERNWLCIYEFRLNSIYTEVQSRSTLVFPLLLRFILETVVIIIWGKGFTEPMERTPSEVRFHDWESNLFYRRAYSFFILEVAVSSSHLTLEEFVPHSIQVVSAQHLTRVELSLRSSLPFQVHLPARCPVVELAAVDMGCISHPLSSAQRLVFHLPQQVPVDVADPKNPDFDLVNNPAVRYPSYSLESVLEHQSRHPRPPSAVHVERRHLAQIRPPNQARRVL